MEAPTVLNAYSSLIQAVATFVLVFLTVYYVRQTKKTTEELERTRKSDFIPVLSVRLEMRDARTLDVYLSNIGQGLAQRPTAYIPFSKEAQAGEVIMPGQENVLVTLENVGTAEILEVPKEERKLVVTYGDIFGRTIKTIVFLGPEGAGEGASIGEQLTMLDWEVKLPKEV